MSATFFETEDIEDLREVVGGALPDLCTIYAPPDSDNPIPDSEGNIDRSFPSAWTAVESDVPCRVELSRFKGEEKSNAGVPVGTIFNDIEFEYDTVVKQSYRIKITASTYQPLLVSAVFDVVDDSMSSYGVSRLIQVERKDIDV